MKKLRVIIQRQRSGRFSVKVEQPNGKWSSIDETFATRAEAEIARQHARSLLEEFEITPDDGTFRAYGEALLERLEAEGKASVRQDRSRWDNHIISARFIDTDPRCISKRDVKRFRDHLRQGDLAPKTQREILLVVGAVFAELLEEDVIQVNPMAGLKLPRAGSTKASGYLYPADDARLVRATRVPLPYRLLYGFLAREGMRKGEALALTWADVDLEQGVVRLDENKTNDPRAWALGPDVLRVLRWWRKRSGGPFVFRGIRTQHLATLRADVFREHLQEAGVERPELFEAGRARRPIRVHDLRATFVTLALAAGRTETWVTDRTGHRSHHMVTRYRRAARTVKELGLGWLEPLDDLLGVQDPRVIRGPSNPGSGPHRQPKHRVLKTHGLRASEFESRRGYQARQRRIASSSLQATSSLGHMASRMVGSKPAY